MRRGLVLLLLASSVHGFFFPWRRREGVEERRRLEERRYSGCGGDWDCPSGKCLILKKQFCNAQALLQWLFKTGGPKSCYYSKCAQCTTGSHCRAGEECVGMRCKELPPPARDCRFSINCKTWERCSQEGTCTPRRCREDRDCPGNRECRRFQCTRRRSSCTGEKSRQRQCDV